MMEAKELDGRRAEALPPHKPLHQSTDDDYDDAGSSDSENYASEERDPDKPESVKLQSPTVKEEATDRHLMSFHEKRSLDAWEKRLKELSDFAAKYQSTLVPLTAEMKEYRSLARWANNKRLQFHKNQLPAHEKEALDAIGFDWKQTRKDVWEEYYKQLCLFKEDHDHTRVWGDYQYKDCEHGLVCSLRSWCRTQRMRFRKNSLQADRLAKLDAIGFNWVTNGEAWGRLFQALTAFKRTHGHFNIPQDSYLGRWAARLPLHKKELRKDQIAKLVNLGFDWRVRVASSPIQTHFHGRKRDSDYNAGYMPATKRQARMDDSELAMPTVAINVQSAVATKHPHTLSAMRGDDTRAMSFAGFTGRASGAGLSNSGPQSMLQAMGQQHLQPLPRQPLQPLPFPPYAMSAELSSPIQLPFPAAFQWSHLAQQPHSPPGQFSTHNDTQDSVGQLSTPVILDELRRRALLEETQLRQQLQQQQCIRQQQFQQQQQQQQHGLQGLQRLEPMQAFSHGNPPPLMTTDYMLRQQLQQQQQQSYPLSSLRQQQELASLHRDTIAQSRRHDLEQLLYLEQQQPPASRNNNLIQQILGHLQNKDRVNHQG